MRILYQLIAVYFKFVCSELVLICSLTLCRLLKRIITTATRECYFMVCTKKLSWFMAELTLTRDFVDHLYFGDKFSVLDRIQSGVSSVAIVFNQTLSNLVKIIGLLKPIV